MPPATVAGSDFHIAGRDISTFAAAIRLLQQAGTRGIPTRPCEGVFRCRAEEPATTWTFRSIRRIR